MTHPPTPSGSHIQAARKARGWSQTRLAIEIADAGYGRIVTSVRIYQIEKGDSIHPAMVTALLTVFPELAVATAAELDAMTPEQRRQHFADSTVDPATLTDEQRDQLHTRQQEALRRRRPAA